ncbi:MAG: hypothetical protein D4R48_00675 [Nitrosomonadales bacterium]|nr:MAG: hypothetical protein D4R48_00675 [Nitrosomonadales bacterium]
MMAFVCLQGCMESTESSKFVVQATYADAVLKVLNFDYSPAAKQHPPGFTANGKHIDGSACYAKFSGESNDTLSDYLSTLKDKQALAAIQDTRTRMKDAVTRQKLDIWQEVLCVAAGKGEIPYPVTGAGSKGRWEAVTIANDGVRKGSWQEAFTVVQRKHLYSITVNPPKEGGQP